MSEESTTTTTTTTTGKTNDAGAPIEAETKPVSYADIRGEWEDRKISLFGAVKSFIGQLKPKQDLTKISLPCVFLRPYSLLEEVASRNLSYFEILFKVQEKEPEMRMLTILQWLIETAKQEHFNHKPFNPVIGEINRCYLTHNSKDPKDFTYFLVEQVKHHPPTCGIRIENPARDIVLEGFYTFQVQFNRNSVTVANNGSVEIRFGKDEIYVMAKAMPDLQINNVILGSKLVVWDGKMTMECKKTGLLADFELGTKDRTNTVKGKIFSKEEEKEPLLFVDGKTGATTTWWYNSKHPKFASDLASKDRKEQKEFKKKLEVAHVLVEDPEQRKQVARIPKYPEHLEDNSSIKIWEPVRNCIIPNKMDEGDLEKQKIEERQRKLFKDMEAKGENWPTVYFEEDKEKKSWRVKNDDWWKEFQF